MITLEDVNGTQFDNQGFWWHIIDISKISPNNDDFKDVKVDFCKVSRKLSGSQYFFTVVVDNPLWTNSFYLRDMNGEWTGSVHFNKTFPLTFNADEPNFLLYLYMGVMKTTSGVSYMTYDIVGGNEINVTYDMLNKPYNVTMKLIPSGLTQVVTIDSLTVGYHLIKNPNQPTLIAGYLFVQLVKTDFKFECNQELMVGKVNTVQLGTLSDYKPNSALVGEYATKLSVQYGDKTLPVIWNESLNDYTFDLDLTDKTDEGKVRFKVIVEANDVLNSSETDVVLDANFETIDTLAKLTELFRIGGVGRLGANLTLTDDLTVSKSVNLIGNDYSIDMASHKLVIPSDLTFKAQSVGFSNGVNSIQQEPNSTVELTQCNFADCTGFGSVIDCQVDLASLSDEDDFTTKLTDCNITNCDMAILSGGNLEVNGCNVQGKISNKNYPYFLYQTDGNATILNSQFNLSSDTEYDYDLEFNTCIFVCGETATVNGYSHTELQKNNLSAFFDTQRNTSTIDVQYYYSLIEANVHLQSSKGFCHSVSNVDYVYKTNITLTRGE